MKDNDYVRISLTDYELYVRLMGRMEALADYLLGVKYPVIDDVYAILSIKKKEEEE